MDKNYRWLSVFFLVFLVSGGFLRIYHLDDKWLWQDEAELALYARQILNGELPNAYIKDRNTILYIGVLIPFSQTTTEFGYVDPNIYGYNQEDFTDNGRLVKHPFGDILLAALSCLILGDSTFSIRFPFAFLGMLSLILTYKLGSMLYNRRIGLMAMAFQSLNIVLILYERQARYYSPCIFFFLGVAYFGLKAFNQNKLKNYVIAALFYVGLACTMPLAAIAIVIIISVYNFYCQKSWQWLFDRNLHLSIFLAVLFITPYLFVYQPWKAFNADVVELSLATKLFRTGAYLMGLSVNMPFYLVITGLIFMLWRRSKSDIYVVIVILIPVITFPLLMISSSFYERMFLVLIPFLAFASALSLDSIYLLMRKKFRKSTGLLVLFILLFTALIFPKSIFSYGINVRLSQYPYSLKRWSFFTITVYRLLKGGDYGFLTRGTKDTIWVEEAHAFLQKKRVSNDEWVFMTIQNTTLLYHTDLKAQLIWPVKKSYLESIQERFWILVDPEEVRRKYSMGNFYYGTFNPPPGKRIRKRHYEKRVKDCKKHTMPSGAVIYECNY